MSEKKTPVLEVKELGIDFGGLTAVNDLDMSIYNEEIVARARQPSSTCSPKYIHLRAETSFLTARIPQAKR